jgi:hypothetical protein
VISGDTQFRVCQSVNVPGVRADCAGCSFLAEHSRFIESIGLRVCIMNTARCSAKVLGGGGFPDEGYPVLGHKGKVTAILKSFDVGMYTI